MTETAAEEDDEDIDEDHEYGVIKLWDVVNGTMIRSHDLSRGTGVIVFPGWFKVCMCTRRYV